MKSWLGLSILLCSTAFCMDPLRQALIAGNYSNKEVRKKIINQPLTQQALHIWETTPPKEIWIDEVKEKGEASAVQGYVNPYRILEVIHASVWLKKHEPEQWKE